MYKTSVICASRLLEDFTFGKMYQVIGISSNYSSYILNNDNNEERHIGVKFFVKKDDFFKMSENDFVKIDEDIKKSWDEMDLYFKSITPT